MQRVLPLLSFGSFLAGLSTYWLARVNTTVKSPYLDEYFHVRQALVYWAHQWHVWDPKITTPPGLYLVSYLGLYLGRLLPSIELLEQLRAHNVVGILLIYMVVNRIVAVYQKTSSEISIAHTAFNICAFPPLFFFSALYYTDVISVLVVLLAHHSFLERRPVSVLLFSLLSLWFRQTNIFWTGIYLGGSEVVRQIKEQSSSKNSQPKHSSFVEVINASWTDGTLYDPTVEVAGVEDYVKLSLSLALAALSHTTAILSALLPCILTLITFGTFIVRNGGVVLGDKDNHVASLHLAQMLYIWPYMAFFSWPVILPSLVNNCLALLPPQIASQLPLRAPNLTSRPNIRIIVCSISLILIFLIVRFNTIIHPFTLADNRHYTFYVFRILRRFPIVKYLLVPAYLGFAYACIGALSTQQHLTVVPRSRSSLDRSTSSSTFVLWLITATLSLATAPLVEPRYFILPWMIWRLNISTAVPQFEDSRSSASSNKRASANAQSQMPFQTVWKSALSVETFWYLLVNATTCWIFLNKTFSWSNEPEPMRFMW